MAQNLVTREALLTNELMDVFLKLKNFFCVDLNKEMELIKDFLKTQSLLKKFIYIKKY